MTTFSELFQPACVNGRLPCERISREEFHLTATQSLGHFLFLAAEGGELVTEIDRAGWGLRGFPGLGRGVGLLCLPVVSRTAVPTNSLFWKKPCPAVALDHRVEDGNVGTTACKKLGSGDCGKDGTSPLLGIRFCDQLGLDQALPYPRNVDVSERLNLFSNRLRQIVILGAKETSKTEAIAVYQ